MMKTDDDESIIHEFPPFVKDKENWQGVDINDDLVVSHGQSYIDAHDGEEAEKDDTPEVEDDDYDRVMPPSSTSKATTKTSQTTPKTAPTAPPATKEKKKRGLFSMFGGEGFFIFICFIVFGYVYVRFIRKTQTNGYSPIPPNMEMSV